MRSGRMVEERRKEIIYKMTGYRKLKRSDAWNRELLKTKQWSRDKTARSRSFIWICCLLLKCFKVYVLRLTELTIFVISRLNLIMLERTAVEYQTVRLDTLFFARRTRIIARRTRKCCYMYDCLDKYQKRLVRKVFWL